MVLLDFWREWATGRQVDPQATLWFMTVLWWARVGKILTFLGGLTIVLDIAGPERLRKFVRRCLEPTVPFLFILPFWLLGGFAVFSLIDKVSTWLAVLIYLFGGAIGGIVGIYASALLWVFLTRFFAKSLGGEQPGARVRIFALAIILIGFHFDLLAS